MKLYIKHMVSSRCILLVQNELKKMDIRDARVELGEVQIKKNISQSQREELGAGLAKIGLELISDKRFILIEKIKHVIIKVVHLTDKVLKVKFSEHLSKTLGYSYTYLANIFSKTTGTTIEKQVIKHKIERAKELIIYDELTLTEIAFKLNYSSVGHLSNQFKKVTGYTPSTFKRLSHKKRIELENV